MKHNIDKPGYSNEVVLPNQDYIDDLRNLKNVITFTPKCNLKTYKGKKVKGRFIIVQIRKHNGNLYCLGIDDSQFAIGRVYPGTKRPIKWKKYISSLEFGYEKRYEWIESAIHVFEDNDPLNCVIP